MKAVRKWLVLTAVLMIMAVFSGPSAFAYSVNTDDDNADIDGDYTFQWDGDNYGYESYIIWTEQEYMGGRVYRVTLPEAGRLKVEVTSSDAPHLDVVLKRSGGDQLKVWNLRDQGQGISMSEQTEVLSAGTYVVLFGFSHDLEVVGLQQLPGRVSFYHNLTWLREELSLAAVIDDPSKVEALPEDSSLGVVKSTKITSVDKASKKQIRISFPAAAGAEDYIIGWRNMSSPSWNYMASKGKTEAVLKNVLTGSLFQYRVAAYASGRRGKWSDPVCRYFTSVSGTLKAGSKSFTLKLKTLRGATGYIVRYSTKKSMKGQKTKNSTKAKVTVKGLKRGKKYYVQFLPYRQFQGVKYTGIPVTKKVTVK